MVGNKFGGKTLGSCAWNTVTTGKTTVSQKPQCKDTEKLFIECSTRNSYNRIGAKSDVEFKGDQCEHET